jgi:Helix-turn-helix of DDE superfamily endonuclease
MDIERIWASDKQLHAVTGLTRKEVDEIIVEFEMELKNLGRLNPDGNGRPAKIELKGAFLMLMMYYRHYLSLDAMGALFDLDNSNVKRWLVDAEVSLKVILVKKNLHHLIAPKTEKGPPKHWNQNAKFISMVLNSR